MAREGSGDYSGADSAARTARTCIWVSAAISPATIIIYILIAIVFGLGWIFIL